MKISGLTTRLLAIDPRPRYRDGRIPAGRPSIWHFPMVELHTDAGLDGFSMAYGPHGDGPALAEILHRVYLPELLGEDPLETERLWLKLKRKQRHLYNQTESLLGVCDVALWDIRGKAMGRPIVDLLGRRRRSMRCYASARSEAFSERELVHEALLMTAARFIGYKMQLRAGPEADIPRLRAVREAVGPEFPLMDDPNGAYTLEEALAVGKVLDELGFTWYEEPVGDFMLQELRHLRRHLTTPILAGETLPLDAMPNLLEAGVLSRARGDVLIKGGITGLTRLIADCERRGIPLDIHTANTPLLDIAHLHVAGALREETWIENHHPIFRFGIMDNPLEPDGEGRVRVPGGPGLGVTLDLDWIEAHTESVITTRR